MMPARDEYPVGLRGRVLENEPMSKHTVWGIGGPARRFFAPVDVDDLVVFLGGLPPAEPLFWLGLGSNLLVRDGGLDATVIHTASMTDVIVFSTPGIARLGAGVACPKAARRCVRAGLVGLEFFAGIPGTVGGALAMNAGAFGGETWEQVDSVITVDSSGRVREREAADYRWFYRGVDGPAGEWFLEARFQLQSTPAAANDGEAKVKGLLARRAATQPMGQRSCGSVFRNPEGDFAARLIEACGLKGLRVGGAVISTKHANFIINEGGATASDVEALIAQAVSTVREETGVCLEQEVRVVGRTSVSLQSAQVTSTDPTSTKPTSTNQAAADGSPAVTGRAKS